MSKLKVSNDAENVRAQVRSGYGKIATKGGSCCGSSSCGSGEPLVKKIGYSAEELSALPEGANMGLSCGNPTAIASLKPGETVLDLGSGGGFGRRPAQNEAGLRQRHDKLRRSTLQENRHTVSPQARSRATTSPALK